MFRNIKNIRLIAILGILVIVYAGLRLFKNTNRSKSFREELVVMDTTKVDRIIITKSGTSFEVSREVDQWKVEIPGNKKVDATGSSVNNALGSLLRIKPDRIATRDPEKWVDYQVDSSGTRVQVFENNENVLDLILGRFGVHGQQQFHTFVRLSEDDEVYAANNFMGISFPSEPKGFRNSRYLQITSDSITHITFNYPADSAFILNKSNEIWYLGDAIADSASVASYISGLRYMNGSDFVDDVEPAALINPTFSVQIKASNLTEDVQLSAYSHPVHGYILHSSYNPKAYFKDENLFERVFKGQSELLGL
jgi:hypothetical protein